MAKFTRRQRLIYFALALANIGGALCIALQSPFFPYEAELKGATAAQYGLVFGVFELVVLIMSPIYGHFMEKIGPNFMCTSGIFLTGSTCVLFGQLDKIQTTNEFIGLALVIRITEALGNAGFITSSFSIICKEFPGDVATVMASQESFFGLGMILGPTLGGALYGVGGYWMPFTILGIVLVVTSIFASFVMPIDRKEEVTMVRKSYMEALRIKSIILMMFAVASTSYSIGCIQVGLEPHLRPFGLNSVQVGFMFIISGTSYLLSAPIWGRILDRFGNAPVVMAIGGFLMVICFILIGPAPFLPFEPTLWLIIISLICQGFAFGSEFVGGYVGSLNLTKKNGMSDDLGTYGLVSGLWMSSFAFGAFIGPMLSGYIMDQLDFTWASMIVAVLHLIVAVLMIVNKFSQKYSENRKMEDIPLLYKPS